MYPFRHQRTPPSVLLHGDYGPYNKRELEAARAQLINDVYTMPGAILDRVRSKCGIIPNRFGVFSGCEPHPRTYVSYESQSCALVAEGGWPEIIRENPIVQNGGSRYEPESHSSGRATPTSSRDSQVFRSHDDETPSTSGSVKRKNDMVEDDDELFDGESFKKLKKCDELDELDDLEVSDVSDNIDSDEESVVGFKCDLCKFTSTDAGFMQSHLKDNLHFSASEYEGVIENQIFVPQGLLKPMTHIHEGGKLQCLIPMCTVCKEVFNDVHSCYSHSQKTHKMDKPLYALSVVRACRTVIFNLPPQCPVCEMFFSGAAQLYNHCRSSGHLLYKPPESNERVLLVCIYCKSEVVFTDFYKCQDHLLCKHGTGKQKLEMKILYVEMPTEVKEMLPKVVRNSDYQECPDVPRRKKKKKKRSNHSKGKNAKNNMARKGGGKSFYKDRQVFNYSHRSSK
ncbi:uncharacterized protein LOC124276125 [Haliotis rubra]|uniref:uncharacterized protein LOC124276125 n=1 Tax=Haliotis rubra TaxID=36100 RepID=UPI001EE560CF|nr:uncharacterized protein LOC124276125 [Haliotis rubra]XP_046567748.1 uncharacterized protein LOC124276125 [Haliotis rubra]